MKKEWWHFAFFEAFGNRTYENTLNNSHLLQSGKIHHQEKFFKVNAKGELDFAYNLPLDVQYYVKMSRGSDYFLLPRTFLSSLPRS